MNELALFAGAGGGVLASKLLGWRTVCAVERDAYAASVLAQRQNDGILEPFPIWSDVSSFDGTRWRGIVNVVSGGFPCQDISIAGRGVGITGERSGLWKQYLRIVGEVQPLYVFAENSPNLRTRGLHTVINDLTSLGYSVRWGTLGYGHLGGPHLRKRLWVVAYSMCSRERRETKTRFSSVLDKIPQWLAKRSERWSDAFVAYPNQSTCQPLLGREDDGLAHRLDRTRCIGNGQVPAVAATAFRILSAVK